MGEKCPAFFYYMDMLERLKEIIAPIIAGAGADIVELDYRREAGTYRLKVLVDKVGGINLGECAALNSAIGIQLDTTDIIQDRYVIEVSSPGIDRVFTGRKDFDRAKGKDIRVTTNAIVNGKNVFTGRVSDVSDDSVAIDTAQDGRVELPYTVIAKAVLDIKL